MIPMFEKLGERIRNLRKDKKLTLIEVSEKTGIAQATLSRIETGTMIGTVESHAKIAEVIGISLSELYNGIDERYEKITHISKDEIAKTSHHTQLVHLEALTTDPLKRKIAPFLISIQPGGQTASESNDHEGEKFFYALEGEVKLTVGGKDYLLKAGESIYFNASLPHQLHNEKSKIFKAIAFQTRETV